MNGPLNEENTFACLDLLIKTFDSPEKLEQISAGSIPLPLLACIRESGSGQIYR